jgi:hypothetical protein
MATTTQSNVSLADLLQGVTEVREVVYQERHGGDTE